MKRLAHSIGSAFAILLVVLFVTIGLAGKQPKDFSPDYFHIVLAIAVLAGLAIYARSAVQAFIVSVSGVVLLILRDSYTLVDSKHVLACLAAVYIGGLARKHRGLALVSLALVAAAIVFAGGGWIAVVFLAVGISVMVVDPLLESATRLVREAVLSFGKHARGLLWFAVAYAISMLVFSVVYRCLDTLQGKPHFKVEWEQSIPPSFTSYLCVSAMAQCSNTVGVKPLSSTSAVLYSIQSVVGVFLLVIVLQQFLAVSAELAKKLYEK